MLPFGVPILATVPQRSEFPEGLTNYPVLHCSSGIVVYLSSEIRNKQSKVYSLRNSAFLTFLNFTHYGETVVF